ncbi:spore germination protein [Clostridium sporogenes]|uniref:GerAB/ArcD/ProY family transporter n=1 Tax=Clostridium sporogenes TaxID=1509 RepID=UPI002149D195|nr:spore germination protein [Clostridium sporogenes]MCR1973283.1 spore germination protein [Clostridium sporogenes]
MKNNRDNELTEMQFTLILIGAMLGVGILSLPNDVIKIAKQDGWISVLLGAIYPLYIVFIANYLGKNYPKENMLTLSKRFFGKILGTILNLIFILYFVLITAKVASDISNVLHIYMVQFLSNWTILIVMYCIIAFAVYGGTETVGSLNEIIFFSTIIIFFIPLIAIKNANILNIKPVLDSGMLNILKAVKETVFSYSQIEMILILYPFLQNNKKIKKCGLISIAFITIVYCLFTIINILYLGIETSLKFTWPIVNVTESIMIPVINSFRYIFMSLWSLTMFKTICNGYFVTVYELSKISKKIDRKIIILLSIPLMIIISLFYGNITNSKKIIGKIMPIYIIYNIVFSTLITIFAWKKKEKENNNLLM